MAVVGGNAGLRQPACSIFQIAGSGDNDGCSGFCEGGRYGGWKLQSRGEARCVQKLEGGAVPVNEHKVVEFSSDCASGICAKTDCKNG